MSTQKNEQYHILSPEWLKKNPLPEDGEFENNDGKWLASSRRGHVTPGWNEYPYRTKRTDLPPEAYITPPADTTGIGREGEPSMSRAILLFLENEVEMPDVQRRMIADELDEFLKRAGFGLVEALRRDGERLASQCSDMRESLNEIANNSNYKSGGKFFYLSRLLEFAAQASAAVVADASFEDTARLEFVIQFIQKHGLKGLGDAIVEIYNASDVREFGREAIDKLRAAIDSAQRQEAE